MKRLLATIDRAGAVQSRLHAYVFACAAACVAGAMTAALVHYFGVAMPFLFGLGAVMASAWIGGAGPALLATVLMLVFGHLVSRDLPPVETLNLVVLSVFSVVLAVTGELLMRARRREALQTERLTKRDQYLQSIFETLPAAMMVIDRAGAILAINKTAVELFAIDEADRESLSIQDLIALPEAPGASPTAYVDRLVATAQRSPSVIGQPRGDRPQLHLAIAVAHFQTISPQLITVYLRDETPARRTAEAMAEVQASVAQLGRAAALGAMGSAIAHELNQPLASAANYAGAARSHLVARGDAPAPALAAVDATVTQIVRAGEILKGLRTFVRAAPFAPQWLDIHDVVREAAQLGHFVLNDLRVTLTTRIADGVHFVWTDRVQIQQVLVNLISNAAEAVADRDERNVRIAARPLPRDEIELSVTDTGGGVSPEIRERLFQPFNTSKGLGLGVGLAISKTIIEAHGGRIWYESGPKGARFCLTLKHSMQRGGDSDSWQDSDVHH
ncbi:ATP-binding protein [Sphingomonas donggukensis]|uniref:histidine kinase n=1 Tax=Sphingomonas donggukensis TaxID=2949093 RepID=A0ABY4TWP3_9SPHN|nr:ATP-binding protein [Sphingomonas donggukensis]URW75574.1 ATP-binding protein [Sphingomonas donggukensis]